MLALKARGEGSAWTNASPVVTHLCPPWCCASAGFARFGPARRVPFLLSPAMRLAHALNTYSKTLVGSRHTLILCSIPCAHWRGNSTGWRTLFLFAAAETPSCAPRRGPASHSAAAPSVSAAEYLSRPHAHCLHWVQETQINTQHKPMPCGGDRHA